MVLIGDGVMTLVRPEKSTTTWESYPKLGRLVQNRPGLARAFGVALIAGGVWWALHQEKTDQAQTALSK